MTFLDHLKPKQYSAGTELVFTTISWLYGSMIGTLIAAVVEWKAMVTPELEFPIQVGSIAVWVVIFWFRREIYEIIKRVFGNQTVPNNSSSDTLNITVNIRSETNLWNQLALWIITWDKFDEEMRKLQS